MVSSAWLTLMPQSSARVAHSSLWALVVAPAHLVLSCVLDRAHGGSGFHRIDLGACPVVAQFEAKSWCALH